MLKRGTVVVWLVRRGGIGGCVPVGWRVRGRALGLGGWVL